MKKSKRIFLIYITVPIKLINFPRPYGRGFVISSLKLASLRSESFIPRANARGFKLGNDKKPLILSDIAPTGGHNVIYNTNTKRFQLFDVDSLKPSDRAFEEKFMSFVNRDQRMNDMEIRFLMRMIQLYRERYPDSQLSYEGDEYTHGQILEVAGPTGALDNVIYPDNPYYEEYYRAAIDWRGTRGRKDLPLLTWQKRLGRDVNSINRELLEAIRKDDFEKTKQIVAQLGGRIVEKEFVESKK